MIVLKKTVFSLSPSSAFHPYPLVQAQWARTVQLISLDFDDGVC